MNLRMHFYVMFFTFAYLFALSICDTVSSSSNSENGASALTSNDETQRVERSPKYDFGLGKRRYMITTGGPGKKRLPHYNFGLGKRGSPYQYSFGLGKRGDDDSLTYDEESDGNAYYSDSNNYDKSLYNLNMENWENGANLENKNDIDIDYDNFRPGMEKRARTYNFGLGKRRYDFGLGKRKFNDEYDKRLPNRYNFGLGR